MKTAEQMAKKAIERGSSSQAKQAYIEGIQATSVNPMEKAAAAEDLYLRRVTEASQSGRRRNKLMSVPVTRWKTNAAGKGADRLTSGVQASADKIRAHFQAWAPHYQAASDAAAAIPAGDTEAALAKVRASIEVLKRAAGKPV